MLENPYQLHSLIRANAGVFADFEFKPNNGRGGTKSIHRPMLAGSEAVEHSFRTDLGQDLVIQSIQILGKAVRTGVAFGEPMLRDIPSLEEAIVLNFANRGAGRWNPRNAILVAMTKSVVGAAIIRPDIIPALGAMIEVAGGEGITVGAENITKFLHTTRVLTNPTLDQKTDLYLASTFKLLHDNQKLASLKDIVADTVNRSASVKDVHLELKKLPDKPINPAIVVEVFKLAEEAGVDSLGLIGPTPASTVAALQEAARMSFYREGSIPKGLALVRFAHGMQKIELMEREAFRRLRKGGVTEVMCLGRAVAGMMNEAEVQAISAYIKQVGPIEAWMDLTSQAVTSPYQEFPSSRVRVLFQNILNRVLKTSEQEGLTALQMRGGLVLELLGTANSLSKEGTKIFPAAIQGLVVS